MFSREWGVEFDPQYLAEFDPQCLPPILQPVCTEEIRLFRLVLANNKHVTKLLFMPLVN